jgi:hypothetical protein
MTYSTIYDMTSGHIITDGVQSQAVCDATINTARSIAREINHSVVVEDRGTQDCYRVTPGGHKWRAPKGWTGEWEYDDDCND